MRVIENPKTKYMPLAILSIAGRGGLSQGIFFLYVFVEVH